MTEVTPDIVGAFGRAYDGRKSSFRGDNIRAGLTAVFAIIGAQQAKPPATPLAINPAHPHIIDGEFQSDKYPTTPRGKVPLSVKDPTAQDLLWEYAQRRRVVDKQFADDLEIVLTMHGYVSPTLESLTDPATLRATEALIRGDDNA